MIFKKGQKVKIVRSGDVSHDTYTHASKKFGKIVTIKERMGGGNNYRIEEYIGGYNKVNLRLLNSKTLKLKEVILK